MTQQFGPYDSNKVVAVDRVPTHGRLSEMMFAVATLLGMGMSYKAIGVELHIAVSTVKQHVDVAASRIPGDLPAKMKVVAWVRGATIDVLEGRSLTYEVMRRSRGRSPLLAVAEAASGK